VGPSWQRLRGNVVDGLRKLKEEAPFGKYVKAAQAEWAKHAHGGLRAKRPGLLRAGPVGPELEEKNDFRIKFDFLIYQGFGNLHKKI
jgi:hypothetical protein